MSDREFWAKLDDRMNAHRKWQEQPFYWTKPSETGCAPSGWYQWTGDGLAYLGESILGAE